MHCVGHRLVIKTSSTNIFEMNGARGLKWGDSSIYPFISNQIDPHSTISKLIVQNSKISRSDNDSTEK